MNRQSERWKQLERDAARALGGRRVLRRWDLFESAPDVIIEAAGFRIVADCKAYRRFAHHSLLEEVQRKYCNPGEVPILVTKHSGQMGANVTVPMEFFARLLNELRIARSSRRGPDD